VNKQLVILSVPGDPGNIPVAPMLFIPFVEVCFTMPYFGLPINKKPPKRVSFQWFSFLCFVIQRRKRDSNPRTLAGQRFSRPPRSTALPFLRGQNYTYFGNCQTLTAFSPHHFNLFNAQLTDFTCNFGPAGLSL
jgi:hypothetical protein